MSPGAWILLWVIASIVLGAILGPVLRHGRESQTTAPPKLPPPGLYVVRDEHLDIEPALRRDR